MSTSKLGSAELQAFFSNTAQMVSVGVQTDEAVHLLISTAETDRLRTAAQAVYAALIGGASLSAAMQAAGCFPAQATGLVAAGEETGHLEDTLRTLAISYEEQDRLFAKLRAAIGYPCALLCVLSVILAFTVAAILPVFLNVYDSLAGGAAAATSGLAAAGIIIGWATLIVTLVCTVFALVAFALSRTPAGRERLMGTLGRMPFARRAFGDWALAQFTSALAVYTAAGLNVDDAVGRALATVENPELRARVTLAHRSMVEPVRANGLVQAFASFQVLSPQHIRQLTFGMRSGRVDEVLVELSEEFFQDAINSFDGLVDKVEPVLAGFVTVAVGAALIAVMLPLVDIMGTIG